MTLRVLSVHPNQVRERCILQRKCTGDCLLWHIGMHALKDIFCGQEHTLRATCCSCPPSLSRPNLILLGHVWRSSDKLLRCLKVSRHPQQSAVSAQDTITRTHREKYETHRQTSRQADSKGQLESGRNLTKKVSRCAPTQTSTTNPPLSLRHRCCGCERLKRCRRLRKKATRCVLR